MQFHTFEAFVALLAWDIKTTQHVTSLSAADMAVAHRSSVLATIHEPVGTDLRQP